MKERGSIKNLKWLWVFSPAWERELGMSYYPSQQARLNRFADYYRIELSRVVAVFCALSPNTSESSNYTFLNNAIRLHLGEQVLVGGYPKNREKAAAILAGEPIHNHLRGRKVTAFYHNTLNPADDTHITVDGHLLSAWIGKRLAVRREAEVSKSEYGYISSDIREAAQYFHVPSTSLQATLWLAWRRVNRIYYSSQMSLYPDDQFIPEALRC